MYLSLSLYIDYVGMIYCFYYRLRHLFLLLVRRYRNFYYTFSCSERSQPGEYFNPQRFRLTDFRVSLCIKWYNWEQIVIVQAHHITATNQLNIWMCSVFMDMFSVYGYVQCLWICSVCCSHNPLIFPLSWLITVVRVAQSWIFVMFCQPLFVFSHFSFVHYIFCPSIYGF